MKYHAFISYRRSDGTKTANWLRRRLQSFKLPKGFEESSGSKKISIFLDTAYERGAHDFYEKTIQPALLDSNYLIVIATPDAAARSGKIEDDWMAREIKDFSKSSNSENLVIVRAIGEFDDALPANLSDTYPNAQIIDLRGAVDWNPINLGRVAHYDNEVLKIIAALLEIPLEQMPALRREEERRRQARVGLFLGAGIAGLIISLGVSAYAIRMQLVGQQAIDQSLLSAEKIISETFNQLDIASVNQRNRNPAISTTCNAATQLEVNATQGRSNLNQGICDLEYLLTYGTISRTTEDELDFIASEYKRLKVLSDDLLRANEASKETSKETSTENLDALENLYRFVLEVTSSKNYFEEKPLKEQYEAEFAIIDKAIQRFSAITKEEQQEQTKIEDAELDIFPTRTLLSWINIATLRYLNLWDYHDSIKDYDHSLVLLDNMLSYEQILVELPNDDSTTDDKKEIWRDLLTISYYGTSYALDEQKIDIAQGYAEHMDRLVAYQIREVKEEFLPSLDLLKLKIKYSTIKNSYKEGEEGHYEALQQLFIVTQSKIALVKSMNQNEPEMIQFKNELIDEMHQVLDVLRRRAIGLAEKDNFTKAKQILTKSLSDRKVLYSDAADKSYWAKLFVLEGERLLTEYDAELGDTSNAEVKRRTLYVQLMQYGEDYQKMDRDEQDNFDTIDKNLSDEHHAYLDALHDEAVKSGTQNQDLEAEQHLKTIRMDDRAWDLLKYESEEFDRVYAGEIAFKLAGHLENQQKTEEARDIRLRAVQEFLPIVKKHSLSGQSLDRGRKLWTKIQNWLSAQNISQNDIEPIVTLEEF